MLLTDLEQSSGLLKKEANVIGGKYIDLPRTFSSTTKIRDFYELYGYVTIKNFISEELLRSIRDDLIAIFGPYSTEATNVFDSAILNLDKLDRSELYELHVASTKCVSFKAISSLFSMILKEISGINKPVLEITSGYLLSIAKDSRLVYDFHQESNYMKGFDSIFNFHYPLFRSSTIENGTMSILPGSHHLGTLEYTKNRVSNDSYTDLLPANIEEISKQIPELYCYLELGDVVIFHKDLIHKSNYNESSFCRPVGVSRYTQDLRGDWVKKAPEGL